MTFDFFNTSNLAFGSKLTNAFNQLNRMCSESEDNIQKILNQQDVFKQYTYNNYQVPTPTRPQSACRTNELFMVLRGQTVIRDLYFDNNQNGLIVSVLKHDSNTNKITVMTGSTNLREGYAYCAMANSNAQMNKTIEFTEKKETKQDKQFLFGFFLDSSTNAVCLTDSLDTLNLYPQDFTQYTSISKGSDVTLPYTSKAYECICCVGPNGGIFNVSKNGVKIYGGNCLNTRVHAIVYVKPDDVITGTVERAFKINYNM